MRVLNHVVRRSREHEETLQKIGGKDATLFPTLREALSFCAVLGYRERRRLPLAPSQGVEDIAAGQYSMNDAVDVVFALALAEVGDADILKPERERECIFVYEEYANGGLAIVQGWLNRYADISVEDAVWKGLHAIGIKSPETNDTPAEIVSPSF